MKEGEESQEASSATYNKLEATLLAKVQGIQNKIQRTDDVKELQKLSITLSELLDNLEKIRKMKKA